MTNKRVQYTEGTISQPLPAPTTGSQYLRRNVGNTGWELVTIPPGDGGTLAEALANGNTTDGYDIKLSVGDAITSVDGYVNVAGHLSVSNGLDVSNKKITSALDPTSAQDVATKNYVDTQAANLRNVISIVANWYVNASTGSDSNDGKSAGTAFQTVEHLSQVLCPNGAKLFPQQNTNVFLAAGSYGKLTLDIAWTDNTLFDLGFVIWGTVSQSITGNVTSVVNTVTPTTRGQITVASGTLVNHQRISSPPNFLSPGGGWYNGGAGAIGFSNGLNANAQNSFVPFWCDAFGHYGYSLPTGAPVSVDTLQTTIANVSLSNDGNGWSSIVSCILPDITRLESVYHTTFNDYLIIIAGCDISGSWNDIHADLEYCRTVGEIRFSGGFPRFFGQSFQNQAIFGNNCYGDIHSANFDGGNAIVGTDSLLHVVGNVEFENGSSGLTAFEVLAGCSAIFDGPVWGINGIYGMGFDVSANASVTLQAGNTTALAIPSIVNVRIAGNSLLYSAIPVAYPTIGCFFALSNSFAGALTPASTANIDISGQVQGDILYFNGTDWVLLAPAQDGYVLTTHGNSNNPTWTSTASSGGLHTVINNAARDAYPTPLRQEGMIIYSENTQCYYELQADLVTWLFYDANPALASQSIWYVDQSGNNNNDGKTISTPIADMVELSNRLCPHGKVCCLTNDVTVNINSISLTAISYGTLFLNVGVNERLLGDVNIWTLNIVCAVTSSAPITLSSIVIPDGATAVRGQLATLSGTFVNQERIRITSGSAAGGVCYSTGLNGDAQHTFVSVLSIPTIAGIVANTGHGVTLIPVSGDTCVVDTLTVSFNRVAITCSTPLAQVFIQDAKITGAYASGVSRSLFVGSGGSILFSGCWLASPEGAWYCTSGGAFLLSCRIPSTCNTSIVGDGWCIVECAIQGLLALDGFAVSYGLTLDGGHIVVGMNSDHNHPGQAQASRWQANTSFTNSASGGAIEAENGASGSFTQWPAVFVSEGGHLEINDFNSYCWGASTAYGIGFQISVHSYIVQGTVADGRFAAIYKIPSTVNFIVANLWFAYSDNPIYIANSDCGLISYSTGFIGNNLNQEDNGFYLTSQTGNHAPATFIGMTKSGLYVVEGYVSTTVIDASATGNPILNIIFTDDSGIARIVPVASSPSLTALGGNGGSVIIESVAVGVIRWSITGVINAGSSKYSVRMRISKHSMGA